MSTPEGLVVKEIMNYLAIRKVYAWRNNTGAIKTQGQHGDRFLRFGKVGSSDILGVLDDGRFLAIECKAPNGRLSDPQRVFLSNVSRRGGVAIVARSAEEVERALFHPSTWILQRREAQ